MTFANLSPNLVYAISEIFQNQESSEWIHQAQALHNRYMQEKKETKSFVQNFDDALVYLGMRTPATYAQVFGALTAVSELVPSWRPTSLLDVGSGPGTAGWAAMSVWPSVTTIECLDQEDDFLTIGNQIATLSHLQQNMQWKKQDVRTGISQEDSQYDLVIIANVLNELSPAMQEKIIGQAFNVCKGVLMVIEPGTPRGSQIVSSVAKKLCKVGMLLAPYIANAFVEDSDYYLHFSQRFIRPEFQRRIRQYMREDSAKASDWEEAKYAYVAISKLPAEKENWGRCVGTVQTQKGFLEVPVLTADAVKKIKVLKRDKENYAMARRLKWGMLLENESFAFS